MVVQCVAENDAYDLVHYMVFRDKEDRIYMARHTNTDPAIGELRYIFRLAGLEATVPRYGEGDVSSTAGGTYVEGRDVVLVDGQTRSKFYSSQRFIDNAFYCATNGGKTIHACCKTLSGCLPPFALLRLSQPKGMSTTVSLYACSLCG